MIHLINMPFGSLLRPSLALSQFKAQLVEAGVSARVHHFNVEFARQVGLAEFELNSLLRTTDSEVGEWLFARAAWGRAVGPPEEEFFAKLRAMSTQGRVMDVAQLQEVREDVVPRFLDACVERLERHGEPTVVGFSCTFFQTIASLALGRRLKERYPNVKLVYGGANFHDVMGQELIRKVGFMDAVSLGEADDVVVPLFQALAEGRAPEGLHAVWYRDEVGEVVEGPAHRPMSSEVLEALPIPDYGDYFEDLAEVGIRAGDPRMPVNLPYESSRGCWWGQKSHCTFCGLNADGMSFRAKSPARTLETIEELVTRYGVTRLQAADNIMPAPYYKQFLPAMAERRERLGVSLFYEIKANVTREKVRALGAAGVTRLQPGIESLSTPLLKLLRKGVSALQNVHLLKLCRTYGVFPAWNILVRIPGELPEHYEGMAGLLPKLQHFYPPLGGPRTIELHRFSPYFSEAGRWTENLQPRGRYAWMFPEEEIDLNRVAYYFEADWKDVLEPGAYDGVTEAAWDWAERWGGSESVPSLTLRKSFTGGMTIDDHRPSGGGMYRLSPVEALVYEAVDDPMSAARVAAALGGSWTAERAGEILDEFVAHGLAVEEGGTYLGLALPAEVPAPDEGFRRRHYGTLLGRPRSTAGTA